MLRFVLFFSLNICNGFAANRISSVIDAEKVSAFEKGIQELMSTYGDDFGGESSALNKQVRILAKKIFYPDAPKLRMIVTNDDILISIPGQSPIRMELRSSDKKSKFISCFYDQADDDPIPSSGTVVHYRIEYFNRRRATDPIVISQDRLDEAFAKCAMLDAVRSPEANKKIEALMKMRQEAWANNTTLRNGNQYLNPEDRIEMIAPLMEVIQQRQAAIRAKLGSGGARMVFKDGVSFRAVLSRPGAVPQFTLTPFVRANERQLNDMGLLNYEFDVKTKKFWAPDKITSRCSKEQVERIEKALIERQAVSTAEATPASELGGAK